MRANRLAFGDPELLAPAALRAALAREFRDPQGRPLADCWFNPRGTRTAVRHDGAPVRLPGCWAVWWRIELVDSVDDLFAVAREAWVDVYPLDGSHGLPTEPGDWLIPVMLESDIARACNLDRGRMLDEMRYDTALKDNMAMVAKREEFMRSREFQRIMERGSDAVGHETLSGDEKAAARRALDEKLAMEQRDAEQVAREMLWNGVRYGNT